MFWVDYSFLLMTQSLWIILILCIISFDADFFWEINWNQQSIFLFDLRDIQIMPHMLWYSCCHNQSSCVWNNGVRLNTQERQRTGSFLNYLGRYRLPALGGSRVVLMCTFCASVLLCRFRTVHGKRVYQQREGNCHANFYFNTALQMIWCSTLQ